MKHLVHKKLHPHLKKRAILEIVGFAILLVFSASQWNILKEALNTITSVEAGWFILLLVCYWIILPLTAVSYKLISPKPQKLKITTTSLAHLAGAGPGRIIPGGIGNLSIGAMHLKKTGLSIEQGLSVVATNNIIGLITTASLVLAVLLFRPETIGILTDNISSLQLIIAALIGVALVVILQWLLHIHRTHDEIIKTARSWQTIIKRLLKSPTKLIGVVIISLAVLLTHTFILEFSGFALNTSLGFVDALIALSFGVAIGSILPTPGGIGGVEAGIVAALLVLGYDAAAATSIAVLFRIVTYWQPLIPGTLAYLYLREKNLL